MVGHSLSVICSVHPSQGAQTNVVHLLSELDSVLHSPERNAKRCKHALNVLLLLMESVVLQGGGAPHKEGVLTREESHSLGTTIEKYSGDKNMKFRHCIGWYTFGTIRY